MWMLFVLSSMAVALAALWFTLFAEVKGWAGLNYVSTYLAVWLPIVSLVTLAMLCSLAVRSGVRWRAVAVFSFALAAIAAKPKGHSTAPRPLDRTMNDGAPGIRVPEGTYGPQTQRLLHGNSA